MADRKWPYPPTIGEIGDGLSQRHRRALLDPANSPKADVSALKEEIPEWRPKLLNHEGRTTVIGEKVAAYLRSLGEAPNG